MRRRLIATLVALLAPAAARAEPHDSFARIDAIDRASLVMTVEAGIVPRDLGARIARALEAALAARPEFARLWARPGHAATTEGDGEGARR